MVCGSPRLYLRAALGDGRVVVPAHHLGTVLRRRPGDAVRVFNAEDGEWLARIEAIDRRQAVLGIERRLREPAPEPGPWLAFALLRREMTELVVQKATELGAAAILPVATERTQPARWNAERLAAIAVEAAAQCERLTLPELRAPQPLAALLAGWPAQRLLAAAIERADAPGLRPGAGGLLVGPEGGFTPGELDLLHDKPFIQPVSLGPRILRAETAAIAGLALLQAQAGEG